MDWSVLLESAIETVFSRSNGEPLLHLPRREVMNVFDHRFPAYETYSVHPLTPWFDRMNWYILAAKDHGLPAAWRTRMRCGGACFFCLLDRFILGEQEQTLFKDLRRI